MKTSSIAEAKNNLPQLIYQLEANEVIHLTRHGKPVAVMLSEANYQKLTGKGNKLSHAIHQWRKQLTDDIALTETELRSLRSSHSERSFAWEE
jgi:prevent-host-death family protein